jgi:hypothetical protein
VKAERKLGEARRKLEAERKLECGKTAVGKLESKLGALRARGCTPYKPHREAQAPGNLLMEWTIEIGVMAAYSR